MARKSLHVTHVEIGVVTSRNAPRAAATRGAGLMPPTLAHTATHLGILHRVCGGRIATLSDAAWTTTEMWDWYDGPLEWVARAGDQWWVCCDTFWIDRVDLPAIPLPQDVTMPPRMRITRAVRVTAAELAVLEGGAAAGAGNGAATPALAIGPSEIQSSPSEIQSSPSEIQCVRRMVQR